MICEYCKKRILRDKLAAKIALAGRINQDKGEVRYYPCPKGNGWHLTSQSYRRKK